MVEAMRLAQRKLQSQRSKQYRQIADFEACVPMLSRPIRRMPATCSWNNNPGVVPIETAEEKQWPSKSSKELRRPRSREDEQVFATRTRFRATAQSTRETATRNACRRIQGGSRR